MMTNPKVYKQRRLDTLVRSLIGNDGPGENGRASSDLGRVFCSELEEAIEIAESLGLTPGFKPYHFFDTSHVWTNQVYVDEVIEKKVGQLLHQTYKHDLFQLITNVEARELLSPLADTVAGRTVEVSMNAPSKKFRQSPFEMVCRYIELSGLQKEFWGIRTYHFPRAGYGIFKDQAVRDELIMRKIDILLEKQFSGSLVNLIQNVSSKEVFSPFTEYLNRRPVEVCLRRLQNHHNAYEIISRYIIIQGLQPRFSNFQPYHLAKTTSGTFNDRAVRDSLLVRKIDQLLEEWWFDGDFTKLLAHIDGKRLAKPFIDELDGAEIEVNMQKVCQKLGESPYRMLRRYSQLKGKTFPYARNCFIKNPRCRSRRIAGNLNYYDLSIIRRKGQDTSTYGFRQYDGDEKSVTHQLIADLYKERLPQTPAVYLGLETETFTSLLTFNNMIEVDISNSTVIERDKRVFNAMKGVQKNGLADTRSTLQGLDIRYGDFYEEIALLDGQYSLINFDTCGHLSKNKIKALVRLFERNIVADHAVIYVTLDNSGLGKSRAQKAGFDDQIDATHNEVVQAGNRFGYDVAPEFDLEYVGGTNGNTRPMLLLGYYAIGA